MNKESRMRLKQIAKGTVFMREQMHGIVSLDKTVTREEMREVKKVNALIDRLKRVVVDLFDATEKMGGSR